MTSWIIDEKTYDFPGAVSRLAPALLPDFLASRGGLLFKAVVRDDDFLFGGLPWLWEGERCHHYDIDLPPPEERHVIGSLTAGGTLTLLFKNPGIDADDRESYRSSIRGLSRLFTVARPGLRWPLDGVTQGLFLEAGLWDPAPEDLEYLVNAP